MAQENEEIRKRNELANLFAADRDKSIENILAAVGEKVREFLDNSTRFNYYGASKGSVLADKLLSGLISGKYKKPSEFFKKEMPDLTNGYILPRFKDMFLYSVDNVNSYQYSDGYYRRSFRTKDYAPHINKILGLVSKFNREMNVDADICDILTHNVDEKSKAYIEKSLSDCSWHTPGYCSEAIAYELDKGNKKLEDILTDIINGEGTAALNIEIIRGIIKSRSAEMHELLCRLLLAAKLQEGLRQSICENADCGTIEAFTAILKTISENDLIRFSAVKRAVGTWTGLMTYETRDLERISGKTVSLICECVTDKTACEKYLCSEDSMEIYIALWAYAFTETKDAMNKIIGIMKNGTHHQLLTAGYFVQNLDNEMFAHKVASAVIAERSDSDLMAVYMPYFMRYWDAKKADGTVNSANALVIEAYFADKAEAEKYYDRLWELYDIIPKKTLEFSPCVFPWNTAKLEKSDIIAKLCVIAWLLGDNDKIDKCVGLLKNCESRDRICIIRLILKNPATPVQKAAFTEALADKDSYNRKQIFEMAEKISFDDENYLQMEDMLRYKAADMRAAVIKLLYRQNDDKLCKTAERLMSDKKEEKRTAGLDIIMQLMNDSSRQPLFEKCRSLAAVSENTTAKEKILIEQINKTEKTADTVKELYSEDAVYFPKVPEDYIKKAEETFKRYFDGKNKKDFLVVTDKLLKLIEQHIDDEFIEAYSGEAVTIGANNYFFTCYENGENGIPFPELWEEFYNKEIGSPELLYRTQLFMLSEGNHSEYTTKCGEILSRIIGKELAEGTLHKYHTAALGILGYLSARHIDTHDKKLIAAYVIDYICKNKIDIYFKCSLDGRTETMSLLKYKQTNMLIYDIDSYWKEDFSAVFPLRYIMDRIVGKDISGSDYRYELFHYPIYGYGYSKMSHLDYIFAAYCGIISEDFMYKTIFENTYPNSWRGGMLDEVLSDVSEIYRYMREYDSPLSSKVRYYIRRTPSIFKDYTGAENPAQLTDEGRKIVKFCEDIYTKLTDTILAAELTRGDTETKYSRYVRSITRIYGLENFIAILTALGKDTLERSLYFYSDKISKKTCLCHLLGVCVPAPDDTAEKLKNMLSGTDITEKRLIEAALYSSEWLDIVGEYLNWDGFKSACYYFMAHMNESFDDRRKAMIAKYTPLTDEELNLGAFDIDWFRSAYETVGEKRFGIIYDSAKYISDGSKHSRARKYADAVLGKLDAEKTVQTVTEKRNKDLLMAYALIPIKNEDDIFTRYLYLQKFLKESKKFGAQRSASEKKAVEMSMRNLALNAGYSDVTRLTLRMETKLIDDSRELFEDKEIDGVTVRLSVGENGKAEIICSKDGKALKSVPAKLKKNEHILTLSETKKNLTEQYRRTRSMFEQAMEDSTEFTVSEMSALRKNPVVLPIINDLVFKCGKKLGFLRDNKLTDCSGKTAKLKDGDKVVIAHPFALYSDGHWTDYQKNLFDRKAVQPFKQVFRELYIKTPEESEMKRSLRYAGNQIQPAKTVACLKSRRWVADVEDGLQKVYYKENIVARMYAMADWFSPADIEAPTLEWVEFSDRKTGAELAIKDIPDIIFSEVMRDVDLAVSVAHAGGVDPETSHSTIEMRAALLNFTLPLFKLDNVEINGSHAHIKGKLADYSVHLGSGVIHQKGGAMIAVLPVHSQHRGKLFLPFADDDPKTAEIITKVLLFAEDGKIKDPYILEQIGK